MMQKLFLFFMLLNCFNAVAQDEDSIEYDPNLIGEWEVFSYVKVKSDGTAIDTIDVNPDSAYLNLTLIILPDYSMQKLMMPVNNSEDIKGSSENCKWSLYKQRNRLWVEILCEKSGGGYFEIICVSEEELHLFTDHDIGNFLLKFRRIDASKQ